MSIEIWIPENPLENFVCKVVDILSNEFNESVCIDKYEWGH